MANEGHGAMAPANPAQQANDQPMYMTQFLDTIDNLVVPFLGFAMGFSGYLLAVDADKHRIAIGFCFALVVYSLFACLVLLGLYQQAVRANADDPATGAKVKLLKMTLYTATLLAFGWSSVTAIIPGTAGIEIGYGMAAGAGLLLLAVIVFDFVPCPHILRRLYDYCFAPPHQQEPMIATHHRQAYRYIFLPMMGFVMVIQIYLLRQSYDKDEKDPWLKKHRIYMHSVIGLAVSCVITGLIVLDVYKRSTADLKRAEWIRFFRAMFYATGCSAWGICVTIAFIPDRSSVTTMLWVLVAGTAGTFVVVSTFLNWMKLLIVRIYDCVTGCFIIVGLCIEMMTH